MVEGFLVYYKNNGSSESPKITLVGFQTKTADVKPRDEMATSFMNEGAVLIRGRASARNPREPKAGWRYMTSKQGRDFLCNSLLLAMPLEWLHQGP